MLVFLDVFKAPWKMKIVKLKKSSRCFEEMSSWTHILKTSWNISWNRLDDVLKTSWKQAESLPGIFVSNKSKCVSNKSIFHKFISDKSKANPKCINQNPVISALFLFWNSRSISIWRINISDDYTMLWNQLNSIST